MQRLGLNQRVFGYLIRLNNLKVNLLQNKLRGIHVKLNVPRVHRLDWACS